MRHLMKKLRKSQLIFTFLIFGLSSFISMKGLAWNMGFMKCFLSDPEAFIALWTDSDKYGEIFHYEKNNSEYQKWLGARNNNLLQKIKDSGKEMLADPTFLKWLQVLAVKPTWGKKLKYGGNRYYAETLGGIFYEKENLGEKVLFDVFNPKEGKFQVVQFDYLMGFGPSFQKGILSGLFVYFTGKDPYKRQENVIIPFQQYGRNIYDLVGKNLRLLYLKFKDLEENIGPRAMNQEVDDDYSNIVEKAKQVLAQTLQNTREKNKTFLKEIGIEPTGTMSREEIQAKIEKHERKIRELKSMLAKA